MLHFLVRIGEGVFGGLSVNGAKTGFFSEAEVNCEVKLVDLEVQVLFKFWKNWFLQKNVGPELGFIVLQENSFAVSVQKSMDPGN